MKYSDVSGFIIGHSFKLAYRCCHFNWHRYSLLKRECNFLTEKIKVVFFYFKFLEIKKIWGIGHFGYKQLCWLHPQSLLIPVTVYYIHVFSVK